MKMATTGSKAFETETVSLEFNGAVAVLRMTKKDNRFTLAFLRDMNRALDFTEE